MIVLWTDYLFYLTVRTKSLRNLSEQGYKIDNLAGVVVNHKQVRFV